MSDLRYALRLLRKNPGFTLLSTSALGLGIGATAAILAVVHSVLLTPLPALEPDRLVVVWRTSANEAKGNHAAADFLDLQQRNRTFASIAGYRQEPLNLTGENGEPDRLTGVQVTPEFFDVLGIGAVEGRLIRAASDRPGSGLAVISEGLWQRRFARSPGAIGRVLRLNDRPFTIVGIVPTGFLWPDGAEIWALSEQPVPIPPLEVEGELLQDRDVHYFNAIGRLRPGVTLEQANDDLARVATDMRQASGETDAQGFRADGVHEELVGPVRPALYVLLGAAGFVLLIGCANAASLLLSRAAVRRGEISVRVALGADRRRIVRQLLVESAALGLAAAVAGVLFGTWGLRILLSMAPDIPRLPGTDLYLPVVVFGVLLSLGTVAVFGLVPALQMSSSNVAGALKEGGQSRGTARSATRGALVVLEIGLALVLLAGAGLLMTSFVRLLNVDPGFAGEDVVAISIPLPESVYPPPRQTQFYRDLLERLSQFPDTREAAIGFPAPLGGIGGSGSYFVEGRPPRAGETPPSASLNLVSPAYFRVLRIPVLRGRVFDNREASGEPSAVIVNATLARRAFANDDPIGQRLVIGGEDGTPVPIVGVVADVRWTSLTDEPQPALYLSPGQFPLPFMSLLVRSTAGPARVGAIVREQIGAMDASLPVDMPETIAQIVGRTAAQPRFRTALLTAFAAIALTLAAIGVYGIVSQSVAQRVREIGVRLALGAAPRQVVGLVLAEGLRLALVGVAVGLAGALALARVLDSLLFGVDAADPLTLGVVVTLIVGVSAAATLVPARRALRVDPATVLRSE